MFILETSSPHKPNQPYRRQNPHQEDGYNTSTYGQQKWQRQIATNKQRTGHTQLIAIVASRTGRLTKGSASVAA